MPSSNYRPVVNAVIGINYPSGSSVTRCQQVVCRKRTWSNTPNFWLQPKDALPVNSYVDEQYSLRQPIMVKAESFSYPAGILTGRIWDGRTDNGLETLLVDYAAIANTRVRSESSQINDTALKALVKIADVKANLGVSLKEASKTSDMILDRANRLFKAYTSFRRGQFRKVAQNLNLSRKTVHSTWLEYQYGWMPLMMEVKGAAEFLAQHAMGRPQRFTVSATTTDKTDVAETGALEGWDSMGRRITYTRQCNVRIWCEVSNLHLSQLQQLGITNPLLYAWEIIPYSFVFDWFCSVGDFLTGLSALHGINVRRSMRSFEKVLKISRSGQMNQHIIGNTRNAPYSSNIQGDYRAYQRDSYFVDPTSYYPPLGTGVGSFRRLVSGLALLRTNSRRFS